MWAVLIFLLVSSVILIQSSNKKDHKIRNKKDFKDTGYTEKILPLI